MSAAELSEPKQGPGGIPHQRQAISGRELSGANNGVAAQFASLPRYMNGPRYGERPGAGGWAEDRGDDARRNLVTATYGNEKEMKSVLYLIFI